jgi:NADH-quinone oxidoreductase subunit J
MSGLEIIFLIIAVMTLYAALQVVSDTNLVHAALWLILTLFGVAIVFVLLSATFLAVVQVVVYIGAIAVLMVFAVMLTRKVMSYSEPQLNKNVGLAAVLGLLMFAGLTAIIFLSGAAGADLPELAARSDMISDLGVALVNPQGYILPFEVASVLLLAALIGAIVVAWKK